MFPDWLQVLKPTPSDGDENILKELSEIRQELHAQGKSTSHNLDWVQHNVVDRMINTSQQNTEHVDRHTAALRNDVSDMKAAIEALLNKLSEK